MVGLTFYKLMSLKAYRACRFYSFGLSSLSKAITAKSAYLSGALWLILVVFLLASCSGPKNEEDVQTQNPEAFQSYQLSIDAERKSFSSLIESIEVVPLEETDSSLLTSASRVLKHRDEYLVINKGDEEIVFFDSEGKYLRTFRQLGQGPGEYRSINSFWIKGNVMSIYERSRSIIFRYTLVGDFIDSRMLPAQVGHVGEYEGEYIVEFNFNPILDSMLYKFGVLDKELKPKDLYLKTAEFDAAAVWSNENSVIPYNDGMLLVRMYCDTVYYYSKGQFQPLIHLNFGKDWYWEDGAIIKKEDYGVIENSGQAWDVITSLSDKLIYTKSVIGFSHYEHHLIDRSTGKVARIDLSKDASTEYALNNLSWEEGKWLVSMSAEDLLQLSEELGYDLPNLDQLSRSENPALVKVKFKDSAEW